MWTAIISFIGGPVISGLIKAYQAKLAAGTTDHQIAADAAATEIAENTKIKIAEVGHPWEPEKLAMYITLAYYAKCVVWDTMLGFGSTGALKGDVSSWAAMIMGFYFTKRAGENIARIVWR